MPITAQQVGAQGQRGRIEASEGEGGRVLGAEVFNQPLRERHRQGAGLAHVGHRVFVDAGRRRNTLLGSDASQLAQHRIGEGAASRSAQTFGGVYGAVDRGVVGDAVEVDELIGRDAQDTQQARVDVFDSAAGGFAQGQIQHAAASQHAIDQLGAEAPVLMTELRVGGEGGPERAGGEGVVLEDSPEHLQGDAACVGFHNDRYRSLVEARPKPPRNVGCRRIRHPSERA